MNSVSDKKNMIVPKGDVIMRQGEEGHAAYIVEKGRVEIIITTPDGVEQSVGTRGTGTMIGEMALIDNAPRTATIKALEECTLLEITQDDFSRRLSSIDPVLQMTMQVIITRYRDMLARASIVQRSIQWPPPEIVELSYAQQSEAVENIKIAHEFRKALDEGELSLHYQPLVSLSDSGLIGFEALMRWHHPERGFISPAIFIPVAEESGHIVAASQWALQEACQALKRIERGVAGHKDLIMSVNFSSYDLASKEFIGGIYNTLSTCDIEAHQVQLEITERVLMDQPDNARDTLEQCRDAGLTVAIDDFGTGYSSLSYLQYFPIDTLKIDRSFVKDMLKNDSSMALIKSIIALGRNLGMKTVAEGVEERAEAIALRDMGCDLAQGYYFAKPMAEDAVIEFLNGDGIPAL